MNSQCLPLGYEFYRLTLSTVQTTLPLKLVQVERVELPEPFKALRLQRKPLPLRYKLALKISTIIRIFYLSLVANFVDRRHSLFLWDRLYARLTRVLSITNTYTKRTIVKFYFTDLTILLSFYYPVNLFLSFLFSPLLHKQKPRHFEGGGGFKTLMLHSIIRRSLHQYYIDVWILTKIC